MAIAPGLYTNRILHSVGDAVIRIDRWNAGLTRYDPASIFAGVFPHDAGAYHVAIQGTWANASIIIARAAGPAATIEWKDESVISEMLDGSKFRRASHRASTGNVDAKLPGRWIYEKTLINPHPYLLYRLGHLLNYDYDPDQFRLFMQFHGRYWRGVSDGTTGFESQDYIIGFNSGRSGSGEDARDVGFYMIPAYDAIDLTLKDGPWHIVKIRFIGQYPESFQSLDYIAWHTG